jgi:hypothetical protein
MAANRSLQKQDEELIRPLFEKTVRAIRMGIGDKAFRPFGGAVNAAVMDALLYGVASRLASAPLHKLTALKSPHEALLKDKQFLDAVTKATADVENVKIRLDAAKQAFAEA